MVTAATATAATASAGTGFAARAGASILLAATATGAPTSPAARTATGAIAAPGARAGRAAAADRLAAVGDACGTEIVGSTPGTESTCGIGRERLSRRIRRQETRTRASGNHAVSAGRTQTRPPLSAA